MTKLTPAQRWALQAIKDGWGESPATLGQRMMERPGAMGDRTTKYKAQGYGRMGGSMMKRLSDMGLVVLSNRSMRTWHPTRATILGSGEAVLKDTP